MGKYNKEVECNVCHKHMRTDNIQRHKASYSCKPSSIQKLEDVSTNNSVVADNSASAQNKPFTLGILDDLVNKKESDSPAHPSPNKNLIDGPDSLYPPVLAHPAMPPAKRSKMST